MSLQVAFDLGTTTIAASLLDSASGTRLAVAGCLNPQRTWGSDVLARLTAAADPEQAQAMQTSLAREMERLTDELLGQAGRSPAELAGVALAGNPAMEHLALLLPVT